MTQDNSEKEDLQINEENAVELPTEKAPVEQQSSKNNKMEKKFKKMMKKRGLLPFEGINRVTLRTSKNFIMYIDDPLVMKTKTGNSYVIYGEPKFLDFKKEMGEKEAEKFTKDGEEDKPEEKTGDIQKEEEEEDDGKEIDKGDLPDDDIQSLMDYSNCTRNVAIKTLKKTNGDLVEAITLLT